MQLSNTPGKLLLPFAADGTKNAIPVDSQIGIVAGKASLADGFPPLTRTPLSAGGVPPSGLDMNGILYEMSAIVRWANAGGGYAYDATFATDTNVGGYPKGARVMRSDGLGYWMNTVENNTTDPEAAGAAAAGWVPDYTSGAAAVTMTNANVTLTPLEYGKRIILLTGVLTANLNLIFPNIAGAWVVLNKCTGAFAVTCKTAAGTGVAMPAGTYNFVSGEGVNIYGIKDDLLSLTFTQSGAGAVSRTALAKMRDIVNVRDFGATGNGSTDDTAAILAAVTAAAGKTLIIPDPTVAYKMTAGLTIPAGTKIHGNNKRTTRILKAFTGDLFTLSENVTLSDLWLDGNGVNGFTGRGLLLTSTDGHQEVMNCRVVDFKGFCVDYLTLTAGSQSAFINCELSQYSAPTGSASNVAVNMLAGAQLSAVPRTFIGIQTNGTPAFNFGGCNNVFVSNSFLGDLYYTNNSRGVLITGCRIANQASLVVDGHNNTIIGCDIAPRITIAAGSSADNISIMGNSYNILPIIDSSGNGRNTFSTYRSSYTPILTSGGTPPVLGNGTLNGIFSRNGSTVTYAIELTTGSTTTLGTGGLNFSIPVATMAEINQLAGEATMFNGTTFYSGVAVLGAGDNKVQLLRDTTSSVTFNSPSTWPTGSVFRVSGTYQI